MTWVFLSAYTVLSQRCGYLLNIRGQGGRDLEIEKILKSYGEFTVNTFNRKSIKNINFYEKKSFVGCKCLSFIH